MVWFRVLRAVRGSTASLLPWTLGEQTLASSVICLVGYHGTKTRKEEKPKKAGQSILKDNLLQTQE